MYFWILLYSINDQKQKRIDSIAIRKHVYLGLHFIVILEDLKSQITPFCPLFDCILREKGRNNIGILPRNKYRRADRTIRHIPYLTSKGYGSSRKSNGILRKTSSRASSYWETLERQDVCWGRITSGAKKVARKDCELCSNSGKSDSPWFPQTDSLFFHWIF